MKKKSICTLMLALTLIVGSTGTVLAYQGGNAISGASSNEVLQVKYDGAAWNYPGSSYSRTWFRYTRNGRTLLYKTVSSGRVTGSVWDDLIHWDDAHTTKFNWGH